MLQDYPDYNNQLVMMYNMIEEQEPICFSTDTFLYFDDSADMEVEEPSQEIDQAMNHLDFEGMSSEELNRLLCNLSPSDKQVYEAKFQKANRICKRDKAKTRTSEASLKLLQPLSVATQDNPTARQELEAAKNKEEEQKRRKRVSAQNSRDKKKVYIQEIEAENLALKQKCRELEAENRYLKVPEKASKPPREGRKCAVKSWLIVSLILFSIQEEKEVVEVESFPSKEFFDTSYLFRSAEKIIKEYDRQPLSKRMGDYEKIGYFTEIGQQQEILSKLSSLNLFDSDPHPTKKSIEEETISSASLLHNDQQIYQLL